MSASSLRAVTLVLALTLSACATTTQPEQLTTQSLLKNMAAVPPATLASCAALNMALVCQSTAAGRVRQGGDTRCACADRYQLTPGGL